MAGANLESNLVSTKGNRAGDDTTKEPGRQNFNTLAVHKTAKPARARFSDSGVEGLKWDWGGQCPRVEVEGVVMGNKQA